MYLKRIITIKGFTFGINSEKSLFSHFEEYNVDICVKLGKILMSFTIMDREKMKDLP